MKSLIKLAKSLDFDNGYDYFDYCINSWYNGNFSQCEKLFADMTKADRKGLINYMQGCYDNPTQKEVYNYYLNLL